MVEVIDYRVSRVLIICKDCGQDVGLYPARHKCGSLSSETPLLPSIPKQYLSAGSPNSSNSNAQSKNNDHSSDGLWNKLRSVRNWKDSNAEDTQGSKLWDKLLSATAYYNNADCDSDNESEKDEWEGETHISRILREYYENKGADLPDWLYGSDDKNSTNILTKSDSSTENNYRQQVNTNLNDTNNSKLHLVNNNVSRDRQPKSHDLRELTTSPTSMNDPSTLTDRSIDRSRDKSRDRNRDRSRDKGRDKSGDRSNPLPNSHNDQYRNNIVPTMPSSLPKNMDSVRYNDRSIKQPTDNTLPPRGRQPLPNVYSASDDNVRLMNQKSHQQLRTGSGGRLYNDTPHLPTNRSKSVGPNPSSFSSQPQKQQWQQPPIPRDLRAYNYNSNPYEGDGRGRQGVPPLGPHGSGRNNRSGRSGGFF